MPFFGVPIRNGLPIGLGSVAGFGVQQFDPLELFASGAPGVWYDPSDTSTLFQDPAGTTPVTAVEQPVGLMLDKSKGLVLGPELVTNGDFSSGTTGWTGINATLAVVNGAVQITADGVGQARASQTVSGLTAGRWYEVRAKIWQGTGALNVDILVAGITQSAAVSTTTPTDAVVRFVAAGATQTIRVGSNSVAVAGTTYFADNISVRELPGNHAISYNPSNARPQLSARVNLLVATATLSTQSVTTQATSYTLSFAGAGSITLSGTATGSYNAGTHTITCTAGTLTLTVSGAVTTADLRPANSGALLPAYQAVVDANTYGTNGFPKYLYFAGVDDGMSTPANLDLTSTDKVAVFAGVRKLSDGGVKILSEFSVDSFANNGAFAAFAPSGNVADYYYRSKGTTVRDANGPDTYAAPISNIFTGISDISGDSVILRIDGTQVASSTGDQGTGNYGAYPLYIGARANSSLWFNGYLYGLTVVGTQLTTPQIESMESWTAQRTGITL